MRRTFRGVHINKERSGKEKRNGCATLSRIVRAPTYCTGFLSAKYSTSLRFECVVPVTFVPAAHPLETHLESLFAPPVSRLPILGRLILWRTDRLISSFTLLV